MTHLTSLLVLSYITLLSNNLNAQPWRLVKEIGIFEKSSSFCLSPDGYFYVADQGSNQVLKLNLDGAVFNTTGGYGWDASGLSRPTDVTAEAVYVLVADEDNSKVNKYDKNLNLAGTVFKRDSQNPEEVFGYPLSVAVSTLGDLYILDGENNRVVYFSFFGDYKGNFGGFGTGFYEFYRPEKISALKNAIAVVDDDKLVLFDLFGTYLRNIQFQQRIRSVKYNDGKIAVVTKKEIYIAEDNLMYEFNQLDIEHDGVWFVDALMSGDKLYILTENSILFFEKGF
jgi:DNA-binding beta-propeller fold protein YncE